MADYQYISSTGVIIPDTSSLLANVTTTYTDVFGTDLITTPDSPAGVFINAEVLAEAAMVRNNAAVANQINPNLAAGTFLDAILALTGVQRSPATQTFVSGATLTGASGTVVPAGTLAATAAGDQFSTVSSVMIGGGGTVAADFRSVEYGPIPCASDALTVVVSSILGWETVNNTSGGALGSVTQSDVGARAYRSNTLGFQGVALPVAITSALYNVEGVNSVWFQENTTAGTLTINGVAMTAHSIYVVVNGGTHLDIAAALLENKSNGCAWIGSTTQAIIEPASGQSYTVKWDYATPIEISMEITTTNGNGADIKSAILNYMAGSLANFPLVTGSAWAIGGTLSCFEISAAIVAQFPQYMITNVEIKKTAGGSFATTPLTATVQQQFFTTASDISVTVTG